MPQTSFQSFSDTTVDPKVRGFLHLPDQPNDKGLILSHGAGGNATASLLVAIGQAICAAGFVVLRCDLPFRQTHAWRPPGPGDAARDRAGLKNAIGSLRNQVPGRIFIGGHSYGGRQSSMLCAEEPELAAGLLLLSYPLHPPRKPEQQRTQHLPDLRTPAMFFHGTRDPFGTIPELEQVLKMIPAKNKLVAIEGAGHDLGFKGKARNEYLPPMVVSEFERFFF